MKEHLSNRTKKRIDKIVAHHWVLDNFKTYEEKMNLICMYFETYENRLWEGAKCLENNDIPMAGICIGTSGNYKRFE